jgi:O-antigen polysaccharide polymerase Wzy
MKFYAVLIVATAITLYLTVMVWRKAKSVAFPVGMAFLYYWSLFGAWSVVAEHNDPHLGKPYDYLYYKMFPVYMDEDYFWSLVLYSIFLIVVQIAVLYCAKSSNDAKVQALPASRIRISHRRILMFSAVSGLLSFLLVRDMLSAAAAVQTPLHFLHPEESPLYTLHQTLIRASAVSLFLGVSIYMSGKRAKFIGGGPRTAVLSTAYAVLFIGVVVFNSVIGVRNTLMFTTFAAILLYGANTVRPRKWLAAVLCSIFLLATIVGVLRGPATPQSLEPSSWPEVVLSLASDQTESVAAHFSMYGTLHYNLPITYGSSFLWLLSSMVPRVIWPNRPEDSYEIYARGVSAAEGQGYTIHHATGWYLNFGVPGVIVGGLLLGYVWAKLFNRSLATVQVRSHWMRIFNVLSFPTFTAFIPIILRSGPEAYKGVLIESLMIPVLVMGLASVRMVLRSGRPALIGSCEWPEPLPVTRPSAVLEVVTQ